MLDHITQNYKGNTLLTSLGNPVTRMDFLTTHTLTSFLNHLVKNYIIDLLSLHNETKVIETL